MLILEHLMKDVGLSQHRLSKAVPGLHQSRLSLIINKKAEPNEVEKKLLSNVFELPITVLLEEV
jgi:predicted XRE-type DNA-binding protein